MKWNWHGHWQSSPDLLILSKDHFRRMCVYMVSLCLGIYVNSSTLILEAPLLESCQLREQPTQYWEDIEKNKVNKVHRRELWCECSIRTYTATVHVWKLPHSWIYPTSKQARSHFQCIFFHTSLSFFLVHISGEIYYFCNAVLESSALILSYISFRYTPLICQSEILQPK